MIVQALPKSGRVQGNSMPTERIARPSKNRKDKRYLLCVDCADNRMNSYVFDIQDQKIVYRATSTKSVEHIFEDLYSMYNRHDTRVVEASSLRDVLNSADLPPLTQKALDVKKAKDELSKPKLLQESVHIKKVRETYKYLDKYKVKLKVKVEKTSDSTATVYLHDEEAGVSMGTHRLEYNYLKGLYKYFYVGNLIIETHDLEIIFKP